jgi:hypothetical protein
MTTRNSEVLKSFVEYCYANPDMRFWQALRNWVSYGFIYASNQCDALGESMDDLRDTYYWEEKSN